MVFQLTQKLVFPDPHYGEPDGLLAVGGDLSVDRLLLAYSNGIFPWYAFREKQIQWWCPLKRFVIFPNEIHISHSMRTFMNKEQYGVSFNQAFHEVIQTCGNLRMEETGAWLGKDIMKAYIRLHEQGFATSVEVWEESCHGRRTLWSHFGKVFFRRKHVFSSPQCIETGAYLSAQTFQELGGTLIDCQFETPHLKSMGGRYIDYEEYMRYVQEPLESL